MCPGTPAPVSQSELGDFILVWPQVNPPVVNLPDPAAPVAAADPVIVLPAAPAVPAAPALPVAPANPSGAEVPVTAGLTGLIGLIGGGEARRHPCIFTAGLGCRELGP